MIQTLPARPRGAIRSRPGRPAEPITSRLARWPVALALLAVAGCGTGSGLPETTGAIQAVEPHTAFVVPPPGGPAIVGIVEQRFVNGVSQDIALSTASRVPGQNAIAVRLIGPVRFGAGGQSSLSDRPISSASIASDMRKALPGVPMGRSPYYVQNRYGPFGYAAGRAASGDLCIYAWQRIQAAGQTTLIRNRGSISIRLRLCDARQSEERLLSVMYGLSVNAFFNDLQWNPYGAPPSPSPTLGGLSSPVYPADGRGFQPVTGPAPAPVRRVATPRVPAPRAAPAVQEPLPEPVGPLVPPPPGSGPVRTLAPAARPAGPPVIVPPPPCPEGSAAC